MSVQAPSMPAPFSGGNTNTNQNVKPDPRTVRASDLTWFNTSGPNIVQSNYNKCTSDVNKHFYPWGLSMQIPDKPFNLQPVGGKSMPCNKCDLIPRFDLYGLSSKCPCQLNRCGCSDKNKTR